MDESGNFSGCIPTGIVIDDAITVPKVSYRPGYSEGQGP
jgi:hypothetical protein